MFYNVWSDLLFLLTVVQLAEFVPSKKNIDKLNKLLKNEGWGRLNYMQVKYHDNSCTRTSFSGDYIFIDPKRPNQSNNITKENMGKKYSMTNKLLGCVYANAVFEFILLSKSILDECDYEVHLANQRKRFQKRSYKEKCASGKILSVEPFQVNPKNYRKSFKLFYTLIELFEKGKNMFDYMSCALNFLIEPLIKNRTYCVLKKHIKSLVTSVIAIRDVKTTLQYEYPDDADVNINKFYQGLKKILNRQVRDGLSPLMEKYCIQLKDANAINLCDSLNQSSSMDAETVEEDETTDQPLEESDHAEVKLKIEKHVEKVVKEYFLDLGFQLV
ncbi:uncharacterized protein LOC126845676 [Adelges cooleyi]|uniref:uncharacterized protein LOC126845676 n=1 Tax=Adelges cooleyi TaxID=133065 RepID=UPI0021807871|nr:uncharacterized protein LOC126845676 [Adelges cooleyi]